MRNVADGGKKRRIDHGSANAQQIVKIFQEAADREEARNKIRTKYKLSERQVEVIADMTLSQVTRLDAGKYGKEKEELSTRIAELELTSTELLPVE